MAGQAFSLPKQSFTAAPSLHSPDPSHQFVVEVDAPDTGAFFCGVYLPLNATMTDNRELLAVKLALQEWRHWLEGAEHPFLVWTDHKNLEYLKTARRLKPHQGRWALSFGLFNFTLVHRPGSKNTKPDALSRLHKNRMYPGLESFIIPSNIRLAVTRLGLE